FRRVHACVDNDKTHALPPSLGHFKLFNVGQPAHNLPPSILSKGGVFLSMYQREAMWMSFEPAYPKQAASHAVKISVGGVNVLTGLPQNQSVEGKQDYVVVGGVNGQKWLDGICTTPSVVRQLVAMPLGTGYTVEGQVTGKEDVGGIQIDVFEQYSSGDCHFTRNGLGSPNLNNYMSPRQLGLRHGDIVHLEYSVSYKLTLLNFHDVSPLISTISVFQSTFGKGKTLRDYNVQNGSTLALLVCFGSRLGDVPPGAHMISGIAAGGQISQKINRDPHPAWAYNTSNATRLHLTVINAAFFTQITGLPSPPSPISPQTYLQLKLPWYSLYDEQIPAANNFMVSSPLANVKSVGQMMGDDRAATGRIHSRPCGYCSYELATLRLSPCGHLFCDNCATTRLCPSCGVPVAHRLPFAAPMPVPGREDGDGVDATSLDERIIKLQASAKVGEVLSFKLETHAVAEPSGISNPEVRVENRGLM
ncbi:hypothetical protein DFH94DRAFT_639389, partial [Russula ochroleuca]